MSDSFVTDFYHSPMIKIFNQTIDAARRTAFLPLTPERVFGIGSALVLFIFLVFFPL